VVGPATRTLFQLDGSDADASLCDRERASRRWKPSQMRSHQRQLARQGRAQKAVYTFDAGYDPIQIGLGLVGEPNVQVLIRLRAGRCFYAEPPNTPTGGRPKRHGAKFACDDPTTWPEPTAEGKGDDPQ
jgi:hypothetical protein